MDETINFTTIVVRGFKKHDHISEVIRGLDWLTADQLVTYHVNSLVHKIVATGHHTPEALYSCIYVCQRPSPWHIIRQSDGLQLPHIGTEAGRLAYGGIQYYIQQRPQGF